MDKNSSKPLKYCFCRSSFIYNTIQSFKTQILTIDTRASDYYSKYHIEGSINLNNDRVQRYFRTAQKPLEKGQLTSTDIQKMLTPEENKKYTERKKWFCLIIMSETSVKSELLHELRALTEADEEVDSLSIQEDQFSGTLLTSIEKIKEEESVSLGLEIYQIFKKERVAEAHVLIDGAAHFFNRYPFMDQDYYAHIQAAQAESKDWVPTKLEKLKDMPHDILDARLFLGDCIHSEHKELLSRFKISHIVNAAFECYNHHEKAGIKYLKLLVRDETDDRFAKQFKEIYDFIHKALTESSDARVFVHCAMGKSRSAAIVIMYLMKRFSWSLRKAHSFVKAKRDRVSPYHGFIQELEVLEANDFQFEE